MYLVFDIGGTKMRVAAVAHAGKKLGTAVIVPTPKTFAEGMIALRNVGTKAAGGRPITAVVGGIPGILDSKKRALTAAVNISDWVGKPLARELEKTFNAPVALENDAIMGGLGEATFGAGRGADIIAFLAIGTGIGGARFVNGAVDRRASWGFEPGHQIIVPDGEPCACGGRGHLEAYVSGGAMAKKPRTKSERAEYLALGLHNTVVHWSPDVVIIGGSAAKTFAMKDITARLKKSLPFIPVLPPLRRAVLGDYAGLYGALQLARHPITKPPCDAVLYHTV